MNLLCNLKMVTLTSKCYLDLQGTRCVRRFHACPLRIPEGLGDLTKKIPKGNLLSSLRYKNISILSNFQLIKNTIQIWVVTCHQYSSDVILQGNQLWRHKMLAVFSGKISILYVVLMCSKNVICSNLLTVERFLSYFPYLADSMWYPTGIDGTDHNLQFFSSKETTSACYVTECFWYIFLVFCLCVQMLRHIMELPCLLSQVSQPVVKM